MVITGHGDRLQHMAPARLVQPYGAVQQFTALATAWATRFAGKESFHPKHNTNNSRHPPAGTPTAQRQQLSSRPCSKGSHIQKPTRCSTRANKNTTSSATAASYGCQIGSQQHHSPQRCNPTLQQTSCHQPDPTASSTTVQHTVAAQLFISTAGGCRHKPRCWGTLTCNQQPYHMSSTHTACMHAQPGIPTDSSQGLCFML